VVGEVEGTMVKRFFDYAEALQFDGEKSQDEPEKVVAFT
jgi:hypothetical protein